MTREEAIKRLKERMDRQALLLDEEDMAALTELIPELAESEDERIRKGLLRHFKNKTKPYWNEIAVKDIIAYLENQKEQKTAEWNDTDMKEARNNLISVCRDWECGKQTTLLPIVAIRARYFLEHLTEPKPAEWSEDDWKLLDEMRNYLMSMCHSRDLSPNHIYEGFIDLIDRLKSLRPSWKPSEEQMCELNWASKLSPALESLYNDLKKLM